ncbi:trichohyalin-like [Pollicipes pollicipes]|uniref:trichohyalin-like n=1 Tax=Pollicipes pollicipes TaxID=41117 RepID=UPI001884A44F|nr:trichohyalin-like [Pollicipes pollicipes]
MAAHEAPELEVEEPPPKPPDKSKLEKDKNLLTEQIKNLEDQLRCCKTSGAAAGRLQQLETARRELCELHRQTDERLQALAPRITETRHAIFKLRDKLKYRTAQQVDDAVLRLEKQVQTQNFKLREEEKVVREINDLKKSKRTLREYDAKKKELDALTQNQRGLRYERDRLYGEIDKNKREEERIHREAQSTAASIKMLDEELDGLRRQRQALDALYQERLDAWQAWQRQAGGS